MKRLLRAASALLFVVFAALSLAQTQLWSSYQPFQLPVWEDSVKMVQGPDGNFYSVGTAGTRTMQINKWSSSGQLLWTRQFDGIPSRIAVSSAWIVVLGTTKRLANDDNSQTVLLRYDLTGNASQPIFGVDAQFHDVALAPNGDAVVAATVFSGPNPEAEYLRYSSGGTLLATAFYTGTNTNASSILANTQGVTLMGHTGASFFIAQYAYNGSLNWSRVYTFSDPNTTAAGLQFGSDSSGALYLMTTSYDSQTDVYTTHALKYDALGNLIYDTTLNLPFNAFAVGPSGQVGIGLSDGEMVQLTPGGAVQWSSSAGDSISVRSASYDANGNLYYAGRTSNVSVYTGAIGMMNPSGVRQWLVQATQPITFAEFVSVAATPDGAVTFGYTGSHITLGASIGLYKVDASGNRLWTVDNGLVDSAELAVGAVVDSSGNTYVLGKRQTQSIPVASEGVLSKFDSNGTVQWSQRFGVQAYQLELCPGGGVETADMPFQSAAPITIRRFSAAGTLMWHTDLPDIEGARQIFDRTERTIIQRHTMIIDSAGNTYVVGRKVSHTSHVLVYKLDASGNVVWTGDWNSLITTSSLIPQDIAVSPAGFVYALVYNQAQFSECNAIVLQLDAATGAINWTQPTSQVFELTEGLVLKTNSSGDAFVLGEKVGINPGSAFVWKLASDGTTQWKTTIPGMDQLPGMTDLAIDSAGNIFATGASINASDAFQYTGFRVVLAKLNSSGVPQWTRLWDDPAGDGTIANRIMLDANGNAVLGGTTWNQQTGRDLFVLRLSGVDGQPLWPDSGDVFRNGAAIFDGGWGLQDYFSGIGLDSSGNIYVGGSSVGPEGSQDLNAVKYAPTASRPALDDQFVGQTVSTSMVAGQTYNVSMTFKNTGSTAWTKASGFRLAAINPFPNSTWGPSSINLSSSDVVNPGQSRTFKFSVYAPMTAGTYNFQWQMRATSGLFGQTSTNVAVQVVKKQHAARFISESVVTTVHAGQQFFVQVVMENVGTNTWTAATGYSLRPVTGFPTWGVTMVPVNGTVAPGQTTSFTFAATAPSAPGTYAMEWQMFRNASFWSGFFGDRTPKKTITVVP